MAWSAVNNILREKTGFQITLLIVWIVIGYYVFSPVIGAYRFFTLQKIQKTGVITVATRDTAHCYYLYRDQPMGFEYELAQAFAEYLGVRLQVEVFDQWSDMVAALYNGSAAFYRRQRADYTETANSSCFFRWIHASRPAHNNPSQK